MKPLRLFVIALAITGSGCKQSTPRTLILDEWLEEEDVRSACQHYQQSFVAMEAKPGKTNCELTAGCEELQPIVTACQSSNQGIEDLQDFVHEFKEAMIADSACDNVTLVINSEKTNLYRSQGWRLNFEYRVARDQQPWTLTEGTNMSSLLSGQGSAKTSAHTLCQIVHGHGGRVAIQ